jgi:hypothetical protein
MLRDWQNRNCNYDAAYASGMSAGRDGKEANPQPYGDCTVETREVSMRGYRLGYEAGVSANAQAQAQTAQQWQVANCNYDAAYAQGMNAQRTGALLDPAPYAQCAGPTRDEALRGYRRGYEAALRDTPPPAQPSPDPPAGVVVMPPPPANSPGGVVVAPPPPAAHDVEAGPLYNQGDADLKCASVCYPERWNGQWRTTVAGRMSVCGCTR